MKTMSLSVPAAFTNEDFAARMRRVLSSAVESGLAGIIVTPGPDLVWLTGYHPDGRHRAADNARPVPRQ
jgi:hypothetical protein